MSIGEAISRVTQTTVTGAAAIATVACTIYTVNILDIAAKNANDCNRLQRLAEIGAKHFGVTLPAGPRTVTLPDGRQCTFKFGTNTPA